MKPLRATRKIDLDEFMAQTAHLESRSLRAYLKLTHHYWRFGALFREDNDLAGICGVHVQSFRRMKEQLGLLFELDETGLWRDPELESERASAMRTSAVRATAGAKGGRGRWDSDGGEAAGEATGVIANAMAIAIEEVSGLPGSDQSASFANVMAEGASPARPDDDDDDDSSKERSSSSSSSMGMRRPEGMAIALHPGIQNRAEITVPSMAGAMANADAEPLPARGMPAPAVPTKREVLDRLARVFAKRQTGPGLLSLANIGPIMKLLHSGYDLERHIVLVLERPTKEPLRHFGGRWIAEGAEELRQLEREPGWTPPAPAVQAQKVFVRKGTPMWEAHMDYRRKVQKLSGCPEVDRGADKGWIFDSLWPPGYEPQATAAE